MSTTTAFAALVMGALGSAHCVLMCGGVVGVLSAALPARASRLTMMLAYNGGRVSSYAIAGLLAGALGASAPHSGHRALQLFAALWMFAAGLHLAGALPIFSLVERAGLPLWRRVERFARSLLPVRTHARAWMLGLLWGWLPCGLVYSALALSLGSGSALSGALTMAAFGLGTLPAMVLVGAALSSLSARLRRGAARRIAGLLLALLGALSIVSALGLTESAPAPHCHCR